MWTRSDLKSKAKAFLRNFYWQSLIVTLLVGLGASGLAGNFDIGPNQQLYTKYRVERRTPSNILIESSAIQESEAEVMNDKRPSTFFINFIPMGINKLFKLTGILAVIAALISIVIGSFILAPLGVGVKKFFLSGATEDEVNIGHLVFAFKQEHYINVVWGLFYRMVLNILFTFLLIIPGIIKAYAYSMVPYLLAEDPTLDAAKAIEISEAMTDGHKWDMFVLDWSFFLWHLLKIITFGLSEYFLAPYIEATQAQLYLILKPVKPNYSFSFDTE